MLDLVCALCMFVRVSVRYSIIRARVFMCMRVCIFIYVCVYACERVFVHMCVHVYESTHN